MREIVPSRIAMEHAGERALTHLFVENGHHVGIGLSGMDDEWKRGRPRGSDVIAQAPCLGLGRARLVMIVESSLPKSHHFGMPGTRNEIFDRNLELLVSIVGMRADRAINVWKSLGDCEHLPMPCDPSADGNNA